MRNHAHRETRTLSINNQNIAVMYYIIQSRQNPRDPNEEPKFFLIARTIGSIELEQITEEISIASSLTRGDVENVIKSFLDTIPKYLKMGYSVKLGELGSLRLTIQSKGQENMEDATADKVTHIRVCFIPSPRLRKEISDVHVQLYPDL